MITVPSYELSTIHQSLQKRGKRYGPPSYRGLYDDTPAQKKAFHQVYALYEVARSLEKEGDPVRALDYYLCILFTYVPFGSAYYERPAILLEKMKCYEAALAVCDLFVKTFAWTDGHNVEAYTQEVTPRIARLKRKLDV